MAEMRTGLFLALVLCAFTINASADDSLLDDTARGVLPYTVPSTVGGGEHIGKIFSSTYKTLPYTVPSTVGGGEHIGKIFSSTYKTLPYTVPSTVGGGEHIGKIFGSIWVKPTTAIKLNVKKASDTIKEADKELALREHASLRHRRR